MTPIQPPFVLDTSSFIHCEDHYPADVFPSVWKTLEVLVANGELQSPHEMRTEIRERGATKERNPARYDWIKRHSAMFVPFTAPEYTKVLPALAGSEYEQLINESAAEEVGADPWIVAMAILRNGTVITEERSGRPEPKIPTVCKHLKVRCSNMLGLMRSLGKTF